MDLYDELPCSELLYDEEFSSLLDASKQFQVSVLEFITISAKELARILQRSLNEIAKFQELLLADFNKQFINSRPKLITEEEESPRPFSTADVSIDEALGGGIYTGQITEIFGESSTGKSQLLMQLCLAVQLPQKMGGLEGKCVYITTEGDLPTKRLQEMISTRPDFKENGVTQDNIFTVCCSDLTNQEHIISVQLPILLEKNKGAIKLIIIDSISHHLRVELQSKSFRDSQDNRFYIDQLAEKLLDLANRHWLAVVVTNQVGDKPLSERTDFIRQEVEDYEYQLGWIVGWKDSTILFRQKYNEPRPIDGIGDKYNDLESILSDDEDSKLIEEELNKLSKLSRENQTPVYKERDNGRKLVTSGTKVGKSFKFSRHERRRKRKIDQRIPNLGLTWANHVSTRILLGKTYKASPLITRGELNLYKGTDPAAFWQVRRTLKVVFSTYSNSCEIPFVITKRGVEHVSA